MRVSPSEWERESSCDRPQVTFATNSNIHDMHCMLDVRMDEKENNTTLTKGLLLLKQTFRYISDIESLKRQAYETEKLEHCTSKWSD